jgi:MFS family permease
MESGEQSPKISKNNLIFLVLVMGLVSSMDTWLSMIETKAIPNILDEWWPAIADEVARSEFATLQGIFGIIVFGVFFIGWYADAYGRRKGMMLLVLIMGVPALMIVFLTTDLYVFLLIYSVMIMGTTSNLWEIPISEEAPAKKRGMYGSAAFLIGVIPIWAILGPTIIDSYGWRMGYGVMFFET